MHLLKLMLIQYNVLYQSLVKNISAEQTKQIIRKQDNKRFIFYCYKLFIGTSSRKSQPGMHKSIYIILIYGDFLIAHLSLSLH